MPTSKAKAIHEASKQVRDERKVRVTIIDDKAFEYHLTPYESVLRGILDPDVPDMFIEVPVPPHLKGVVLHDLMHTSRIAHIYLHDELTTEETGG